MYLWTILVFFTFTECSTVLPGFRHSSIPLVNENYKNDFLEVSNNWSVKSKRSVSVADSTYDERSFCNGEKNQPPNRVNTSSRVSELRKEMLNRDFQTFIISSGDEHQNEYVAPSDERRRFISGLSGSSGVALVTSSDQILWTDTRYTTQADMELDCSWKIISTSKLIPTPVSWITTISTENISRVAANPRLIGAQEWMKLMAKLNDSKIQLTDPENLFDEVWEKFGRPKQENNPIFAHDIKFAGLSWEEKVRNILSILQVLDVEAFVVTALDEIAWLLNLRGSDVPYNPIFRSYIVLESHPNTSFVHLFLQNPKNLTAEVVDHLKIKNCSSICTKIYNYNNIQDFLQNLTARADINKVLLSKHHAYSEGASAFIHYSIPESKRMIAESPVLVAKNKKNNIEAESMKEAQYRDAVALIEFFAFVEEQIANGTVYDELSITEVLRSFREKQKNYVGESFEAISSFGSNSAIIHYSPSNVSKAIINNQSTYLLDSGGQYLDGTTDVTRTIHYGTPTEFQKEAYTRVLIGVIELASVIVPRSTKDSFLDILARKSLFEAGLNYGHGTGHGIGFFLNVHEGPLLISMRENASKVNPGQFFSNEPGYYETGDFGIRLESIMHAVDHPSLKDSKGNPMMAFDKVTLVPYETKLIDYALLETKQCQYLNNYNKKIRDIIGARLETGSLAYHWMDSRTQPITCHCGVSL